MSLVAQRLAHLRDMNRAEISRWFRESEAGWLFYDAQGVAHHLLADEASRFEAEAHRLNDRYLNTFSWRGTMLMLPMLGAGVATALGARGQFLWWIIGAAFLLAVVPAALAEVAFARTMRRFRARIARQVAGRGSVPQPVADQHRRFNLFRMLSLASATIFMWRLAIHSADGWRVESIDAALVVLAFAGKAGADRVDATHRRRKWLD